MTLLSTVFATETINFQDSAGSAFEGATSLTIPEIISWAISAILVVAAIIFFFMLIWGGIRWIMSGGDKANTEAARNQITAALIGLIVIFAAWAIVALLDSIFNVNLLGGLSFGSVGGGT